jgi:hypothetical protein
MFEAISKESPRSAYVRRRMGNEGFWRRSWREWLTYIGTVVGLWVVTPKSEDRRLVAIEWMAEAIVSLIAIPLIERGFHWLTADHVLTRERLAALENEPALESSTESSEASVGPARGPFPPFSLGGSLEKEDVFDFIGPAHVRDHWYPVRKYVDVQIDWTELKRAELIADVTVSGGACQVGIIDVENDIPVAHTDWLHVARSDLPWEQRPPLPAAVECVRIRFGIPRSVGKRVYRLAAHPSAGPPADTFWVTGSVTFQSFSLGGSETDWFVPADGASLSGRTPNAIEVPIDWSSVRDPVNNVIADVTLRVAHPATGERGRGRAMLRDLTDGSVVRTVDWIEARGRGMHLYDYPTSQHVRFALPRKIGIRRYALEVEVSDAGTRAAATGVLLFGH